MTHIARKFDAPMPPAANDVVGHLKRPTVRCAAADARRAANKRRLFDGLTAMSITHVTVTFSGDGENCRIDRVAAWSGETPVEFPELEIVLAVPIRNHPGVVMCRRSLVSGVELLARDFLSDLLAGQEGTADTLGMFCFDAAAGSIHVETREID